MFLIGFASHCSRENYITLRHTTSIINWNDSFAVRGPPLSDKHPDIRLYDAIAVVGFFLSHNQPHQPMYLSMRILSSATRDYINPLKFCGVSQTSKQQRRQHATTRTPAFKLFQCK